MLDHKNINPIKFENDYQPTLCIVVDTEEEFDWSKPHSRTETSTLATKEQYRAHEVYEKYNAIPTYVMDYCILNQDSSAAIMQKMYAEKICEIGTHLHPWINPPHNEEVNSYNSLHGNLPIELERAKLIALTDLFTDIFGRHPLVFKAGRNGVGPNTAKLLREIGYRVDCSVVSYMNMSNEDGPNFLDLPDSPYWFGDNNDMLEVPVTKGFFGNLRSLAHPMRKLIVSELSEKLRLRGIFSRLGFFDLATLTPEGLQENDLLPLIRSQIKDDHKVISLTYHSSTLKINGSPYVICEEDRVTFLRTLDAVLNVFTNELGGRIISLSQLHDELIRK